MNNNILYCILHTKNQNNRIKNILDTWGKNQNIIFLSDEQLDKYNIYQLSDRSDYASGQEKQINSFLFLKNNFPKYQWYVFCDNDTFINTKLLSNFLIQCDKNYIYGSIINCWPNDKSLFYPSGGAGFVISDSIMEKICSRMELCDTIYGDVAVGINLYRLGISMIDSTLFHSQKPEFYSISDIDIKNNISFHYIKEFSDMNKLYKLCYI